MNHPVSPSSRAGLSLALLAGLALLSGCQSLTSTRSELPPPLETQEFSLDAEHEDVVGQLQIIKAREEDTFSDIARRFNVGYEEIASANPSVDPWLPHAGTEIVIPTQFVLPAAPRKGIVINLAAMRLFYFPPRKAGEPQRVITHPIGIGRVGWRTPEGTTKVVAKTEAPRWVPTPSIRKEHAANGDPLPAVVPPGPDNPMGTHALRLGWSNYSIHGTDKPPSIGLRGSHGCLRMYPEDIVRMYDDVPVGTPVRVVNQPQLFGWRGDTLYFQAYPTLEDDKRNHDARLKKLLNAALKSSHAPRTGSVINTTLLDAVVSAPRAIAVPITQPGLTLESYLQYATRVQNDPSQMQSASIPPAFEPNQPNPEP